MYYKIFVFLLFTISFCICDDLYDDCRDSFQCVEKELVKFVDDLDNKNKIAILGNFVTLSKSQEQFQSQRGGESFLERCARFLTNRELRFKLSSDAAKELIEESRSSKVKKILLPLLILLKLKAAIVVTIILAGIALISFKGLGASLIALAIAGATGFKSLLENHAAAAGSKVSYEILPSISSSHWNRAGVDSLPQVYPHASFT